MRKNPTPYIFVSVSGNSEKFKELTENDFEKFKDLNDYLRNFELAQGLVSLLKSNALQLENYVKQVEQKNFDVHVPRIKLLEINDEVNRLLINFLTSGRLYLDQTETRLKRTYGKKSEEFRVFKSATNLMFDNFFEYRFFYKLRNYVQHCGMAIQSTSHRSISESSSIIDTHKLIIEFNPKELLENYDDWSSHVTKDLKAKEKNFSVSGLAIKTYKLIREIDRYIYMGEFQKLYDAGRWIIDLIKEAFTKGDSPKVGTIQQNDVVNFINPAFYVLKVLGVVDISEKSPKNKEIEHFTMRGYCFKISWNKKDNIYTVTSPSIRGFEIIDSNRNKAIEKVDLQIKSLLKNHIEDKSKPPVPLPWREQYKLIFNE